MKNTHSLNVHISRYHNESDPASVEVKCPVCERVYGNKYSLRTHMHINHKDQIHLLGVSKRGRSNKAGKEGQGQGQSASPSPAKGQGAKVKTESAGSLPKIVGAVSTANKEFY